MTAGTVPAAFDHLMVGGGSPLEALVEAFADRTGVRAGPGGRHDTAGTHNALMALGGRRYLELIAADPEGNAEAPLGRRVAGHARPRVLSWAVAVDDLDAAVARARRRGYDPGPARPLRRRRPDGSWLAWRLAWEGDGVFEGVVPFLIEWGATPHPALSAPAGCRILGLRAEHPDPAWARGALAALDVELNVTEAPEPALVAVIETPNGVVTLR